MEAILVYYLQTVGQLARRCINLLEVQRGFERTSSNPPCLHVWACYRSANSRICSGEVTTLEDKVISLAYCLPLTRLTVHTSRLFPKEKAEELHLARPLTQCGTVAVNVVIRPLSIIYNYLLSRQTDTNWCQLVYR